MLIYGNAMKKGLFILITGFIFPAFICLGAQQPVEETSVLDEQLEINKNALLPGSDEQIRLKAASLLLDSEEPAARRIILEVLASSENQQARIAICQSIKARIGEIELTIT